MARVRLLMEVGAAPVNGNRTVEQKMDEATWSRLPPEILEKVLLQLPFRELLRFRAVCKAWLGLLTDAKFLDEWRGLSGAPPLGVLLHRQGTTGRIALPPSVRMITLGLSFLPEPGLHPVTAAGGLLCLARLSDDASAIEQPFYVCHPVTRRSVRLPAIELWGNTCLRFATLWVSPGFGRYKLFVGCGWGKGYGGVYHAMWVFDSTAGSWRSMAAGDMVQAQDRDVEMGGCEEEDGLMQERGYCTCVLVRDFVARISVPVCLQWASETWSFTRLEGVPFSVVQHRGSIYYVHAGRDVSVVRLYLEKEVKAEGEAEGENPSYVVAVLPEKDVKALCSDWKHVRRGAKCRIVSSGDLICISFVHLYTGTKKNQPTGCRGLLCYDTELGTWRGWFAYFWDTFVEKRQDWKAVCAPFSFDLNSRHLV